MSTFVGRVSTYPLLDDTLKLAGDVYEWAKSYERLGYVLSTIESTGSSIVGAVKPITDNSIVTKADEIACQQLLDRMETLFPSINEMNYELLFGPLADRAVTLAENCADYCLPEQTTKPAKSSKGKPETRIDRLCRMQGRTKECFMEALASLIASLQKLHLTPSLPESIAGSCKDALLRASNLLSFALKVASDAGTPAAITLINVALKQTTELNKQVKDSAYFSSMDFQKLIIALENLHDYLQPAASLPETKSRLRKWTSKIVSKLPLKSGGRVSIDLTKFRMRRANSLMGTEKGLIEE